MGQQHRRKQLKLKRDARKKRIKERIKAAKAVKGKGSRAKAAEAAG